MNRDKCARTTLANCVFHCPKAVSFTNENWKARCRVYSNLHCEMYSRERPIVSLAICFWYNSDEVAMIICDEVEIMASIEGKGEGREKY